MNEQFIKDQIKELFGGGQLYCAETTVKLLAEAGGRESAQAVAMATGFCSGAARTCGQCGAVSGAIMGLGLYAGRTEPGGDYDAVYTMVQEFIERYTERFGSLNCYELTGCDFRVAEDQKRFKEEQIVHKCFDMVAFAVEAGLDILREGGYIPEFDELVRSRMAPCGLACGNCVAFEGGPVQKAGLKLQDLLGENFAEYAKRFEGMQPVFRHYPAFAELLDFLTSGSCGGCRESGCLFKSCKVTACAKEKGVDYCFQCDEFPCDHHGFPERLESLWRKNNESLREKGKHEFYRKAVDKPRYP